MKFREVTSHGDYYNDRSMECDTIEEFMRESPYYAKTINQGQLDRISSELAATGFSYLGWSNFYLEA